MKRWNPTAAEAAHVVEQLVDYACIAREHMGLDDLTALNEAAADGRILARRLRELPPMQPLLAIDPAEVLARCADPTTPFDIDWLVASLSRLFASGYTETVANALWLVHYHPSDPTSAWKIREGKLYVGDEDGKAAVLSEAKRALYDLFGLIQPFVTKNNIDVSASGVPAHWVRPRKKTDGN